MGEVLERHYPGHPWMVHVESRHGMAYVTIPILLGNWKYALKLRDLFSDPMLRAVVKAGGEILERFQIPRSKIDVAAFMSAKRFAVNGYKQRPPV